MIVASPPAPTMSSQPVRASVAPRARVPTVRRMFMKAPGANPGRASGDRMKSKIPTRQTATATKTSHRGNAVHVLREGPADPEREDDVDERRKMEDVDRLARLLDDVVAIPGTR